jgi:hypothetical protein
MFCHTSKIEKIFFMLFLAGGGESIGSGFLNITEAN